MRPTARRRLKRVGAVAGALVLLPVLGAALTGGEELYVAANAPVRADAMTVVMGVKHRAFGGECDGTADVQMFYDGVPVLFKGVVRMLVANCRGQVDIPYRLFAADNGQYQVRITYGGLVEDVYVDVAKTVNWLYVRAFDDPNVAGRDQVRIDVAFDRNQGQPLTSGVFASGDLSIEVHLERCHPEEGPLPPLPVVIVTPCGADGNDVHRLAYRTTIPIDRRANVAVFLPLSELRHPDDPSRPAPPGEYNVTATFHNEDALNNNNVPMDPTVYRQDPPANWFTVEARS